jgi:nicotinamidase-related amidase
MNNTLLVNTDTQKCFMSKNSFLYKKDSEKIIPHLKQITHIAASNDIPTIHTLNNDVKSPYNEKDFINETNPFGHGVISIDDGQNNDIPSILSSLNNNDFSNIIIIKNNYDIISGNRNSKTILDNFKKYKIIVYGLQTEEIATYLSINNFDVCIIVEATHSLNINKWKNSNIKFISIKNI